MALALAACDDGGPIPASTTSSLCAGITGPTAVYWDMGNGLNVPLDFLPVPEGGWPQFIHPTYPALGFQHPPAWQPFPIAGEQTVGVDLLRTDQRGAWRYLTTLGDPTIGARAHRDGQITALRELFGLTAGNAQTLCVNEGQQVLAPGLVQQFSNILLDVDGVRMQVGAQVFLTEGLPGASLAFNVAAAPSAEYDGEIIGTFLPVYFQLLVDPEGARDSDADGTPDVFDRFPFDPARQ